MTRVLLVLSILLIGVGVYLNALGTELGQQPSVSAQLNLVRCQAQGGCFYSDGWDGNAVEVPAHFVQYQIAHIRPEQPGFKILPEHEPAPTPERQERLQALLSCEVEDTDELAQYDWPNANTMYWQEDQPAPDRLLARAEAGDASSMFDLGYGYLSGHSDLKASEASQIGFDWILRAADAGHVMAQTEAASAYTFGYWDVAPDRDRALHYAYLSAPHDPLAALTLALAPPQEGQDLRDHAEQRLDLELTAAETCDFNALTHILQRLNSNPPRGFEPDHDLALQIGLNLLEITMIGAPETGQPVSDA